MGLSPSGESAVNVVRVIPRVRHKVISIVPKSLMLWFPDLLIAAFTRWSTLFFIFMLPFFRGFASLCRLVLYFIHGSYKGNLLPWYLLVSRVSFDCPELLILTLCNGVLGFGLFLLIFYFRVFLSSWFVVLFFY